jgi:ligand-binding SRPBCC domain-containing protein
MYVLRTEQKLPITLHQAWEFFSSPKNLQVITPDYMGFDITSELPADGKMYPGLFINYKVSPILGIKMNWTTEITHVREGHYFVDVQRVHYLPPFGILGKMVHPFLVRPKLLEIFNYRKNKVEELFGTFPI